MNAYLIKNNTLRTILILVLLSIFFMLFLKSTFGKGDFFSYWYGAKLLILDSNPYDHNLYIQTYKSLNFEGLPTQFFAPPYVVAIISWLAFFPYNTAWNIWIICNVFFYGFILCNSAKSFVDIIFKLTFFLSFLPLLLGLLLGQMTLLPLIGLFLVLASLNKNPYLTGLGMTLVLLKLHTFLPFLLASLLIINSKERYKLLISFILFSLILVTVPELISKGIYTKYLSAPIVSSISWKNPTIGALLHEYFDISALRFLPNAFLFLYILWAHFYKKTISLIYEVLPLCLVCSPYLWAYDFVFLLPLILKIFTDHKQTLCKNVTLIHVLITSNILFLASGLGQWAIWYPIFIFTIASIVKNKLISTYE